MLSTDWLVFERLFVRQIKLERGAKYAFLYRIVVPLFEPLIRGMIGWGGRLRTRGGSETWYVENNFTEEFAWAFETEIAAHVEAISTGEDFKVYIEKKLDFTSWRDFAIAMGCLHMGQLAEAKKFLNFCSMSMERVFRTTIYLGCLMPG